MKEEFIHKLNCIDMIIEIIKELTKTEENKDVMSNDIPQWAKWVEAQRTQTAVLNNLKIDQECNAIWSEKQKRQNIKYKIAQQFKTIKN